MSLQNDLLDINGLPSAFTQKNMSHVDRTTAIWLFRITLENLFPAFWSMELHDFLWLAGDNLVWSDTATKFMKNRFFEYDNSPRAENMAGTDMDRASDIAFKDLIKHQRPIVQAMYRESLDRLESLAISEPDPLRGNVEHLKALLDLNETETEILMCVGRAAQSSMAQDLLRKVECRSVDNAVHCLAKLLDVDTLEIRKSIRKSSRLSEYRLIVVDQKPNDLHDFIRGEDLLIECLLEPSDSLEEFILNFIKPAGFPGLSVDDFPHLKTDHSAIQGFMHGVSAAEAKGINFLFYGDRISV